MATFHVKIGTIEGEIVERTVYGQSETEVRDAFRKDGYYLFSIVKAFDFGGFFAFRRKVGAKAFILFNKEFRGLVRAGLPIVEGFDILLKRMKPGKLKTLLSGVRERITHGESLSEAFAAYPEMIPRYYPALLHAGEQSGGLAEVLGRFVDQEERIRKTRKKFVQTLTYPAILLLVGMVSMYVMLSRAMPQFASLYQGANRELPLPTILVTAFSNWLAAYSAYVLGFLTAALVAVFLYVQTENGRLLGEKALRKVPLLGALWSLRNQNVFARTMRLLLSGGVPVPQAVAIVADAVPSLLFSRELKQVFQLLSQGQGLQDALDRETRLTQTVGEMIRVGEETGTLGDMFEYLAEHGEEKSDDYLEMISNLIAPLVLLVVGLAIAFLVVAMYLPMFGSFDAIGS